MPFSKQVKKVVKYLFLLATACFLVIGCVVGFVVYKMWGQIPSKEALKQIKNATASEIYTADSVLIGKFYIENRTNVAYEEISSNIINALISTEDVRFFEHEGIDRKSLLRVLFKTILMGDRGAGGGSTLSQQLAKNLYPRKQAYPFANILFNKVQESVIAHRLETIYSKEEIITLYLNTVAFGENIYGIETATQRFFSTTPKAIKLEEAAVLIGLLKANHTYNPRLFPERSIQRRNIVLSQMKKYEFINKTTYDSLSRLPLALHYTRLNSIEGNALYFQQYLKSFLKKWFANKNAQEGTKYNMFSDGFKIYTTINYKMQKYAEQAVKKHMAKLQNEFFYHWENHGLWKDKKNILEREKRRSDRYKKLQKQGLPENEINKIFAKPVKMEVFAWGKSKTLDMSPLDSIKYYLSFLHAGFLAIEPESGHVKAWIGDIDYQYFKYDHVRSKRQAGSVFKPIVYAAALEDGMDPCEYISNEQAIYDEYENWSPANSDADYEGYYSMQGAITHSVNTIAVKTIMEVGIGEVINLSKKIGIKSDIPFEPSIALGTAEISLDEITDVFGVFANEGRLINKDFLTSIVASNGETIYQNPPKKSRLVLSKNTARMMTYMLKSVVDSGTAVSLKTVYGIKGDVAGKTGTTQAQADGWFVGYTPNLLAGVWVGGKYPAIHFRNIRLGQGAHMALPIWASFMKSVQNDKELSKTLSYNFNPLPEYLADEMDCAPYVLHKNVLEEIWDGIFGRNKNNRETTSKPTKPQKKKKLFDGFRKLFRKQN